MEIHPRAEPGLSFANTPVPGAEDPAEAGRRLLAAGRAPQALELLDRALHGTPAHAPAHLYRGLALKALGRPSDALGAFDAAIAAQMDFVPAHVNRAAILRELGRSGEALDASDHAIALDPDFAPAHCNRGLALNDLDLPQAALDSFDRAIELDPTFCAAHGNRGKALQMLDCPEEALRAYERVMALAPGSAQAHVNASHTLLQLGRFERGWPLYEWRKRLPQPLGFRTFGKPQWLGSPDLAGKRLLIHWEQGLGDTIQFCRYARLVQSQSADVVLMAQKSLVRLLRTLGSDIAVCSDEDGVPDADLQCPLLSLPLALRTRLEDTPAATPYLAAEPDRVSRWRRRIGAHGFKVGISWQGNKDSPADRGRSFPAEQFRRIASIDGVRLISLQVGPGVEQVDQPAPRVPVENLGPDFDRGPDAFLDSAAVMHSLDLVITGDTAIAHLAGALRRPTWVALQHAPDWRWLRARADSPWYPGMRLFRQRRPRDWQGVFDAMHAELAHLRSGGS